MNTDQQREAKEVMTYFARLHISIEDTIDASAAAFCSSEKVRSTPPDDRRALLRDRATKKAFRNDFETILEAAFSSAGKLQEYRDSSEASRIQIVKAGNVAYSYA